RDHARAPRLEDSGRSENLPLCRRDRSIHARADGRAHWTDDRRGSAETAVSHGDALMDPTEHTRGSLVAGVYMNRSIADFQRACEVHIAEEQRKPNPDSAL